MKNLKPLQKGDTCPCCGMPIPTDDPVVLDLLTGIRDGTVIMVRRQYDRLTNWHFPGSKEDGAYLRCSEYCDDGPEECANCDELGKAIDRLAEFEDTGLTPPEVRKLQRSRNGNI